MSNSALQHCKITNIVQKSVQKLHSYLANANVIRERSVLSSHTPIPLLIIGRFCNHGSDGSANVT